MDRLAYLPFLILLIPGLYRSPGSFFLCLFLPVLTLFPVYYEAKVVQGLPEFAFWSSILFPVAMVWIIRKKMEGYRFSWLDAIILLHIFLIFFSQWSNSTYKESQKVLFNDLMARFVPYIMAKAYFSNPETRIRMLKVIVVVSSVVGLYLLYESRMFFNIFDEPLRKVWPVSVAWDLPMVRSGLKRAFGPFGHPICAGYYFAMVTPLAFWLWREGYFRQSLWYPMSFRKDWGPKVICALFFVVFLLGPVARVSRSSLVATGMGLVLLLVILLKGKSKFIWGPATLLCGIAGLAASISRGPMAGAVLGSVMIFFGWARRRALVGAVLAIALLVGSAVFLPKFTSYINAQRATAETADQRNAAYRKEMLDNYKEVLNEKPFFGWGRFTVPVVKGQESIDNEYLAMALAYGKVTTGAYLLGMAWVVVTLLQFALKRSGKSHEGRLAWCILAAWTAAGITQATVYAGTQTMQYFYILAGMSEGLITSGAHIQAGTARAEKKLSKVERTGNGYNFSRTL